MRPSARWLWLAATWISPGLCSTRAQAEDAAPAPVAADPVRSSATESNRAAAAYREALDLHRRGEPAAALERMQESYRLSRRAELLYNIARLQGELGDCSAALGHYREYLQKVFDGRYRAAAERAAAELAERCPQRPEVPAPSASPAVTPAASTEAATPADAADAADASTPSSPPEPALARPWPPVWVGWSALAAGAVASGGAVYFTLAAVDARDRFRREVERHRAGGAFADLDVRDEQHRHQRWALALGITGTALLVSGAVLVILAPREPVGESKADLYIQPGLVGARFSHRF